ncbi:hypothetical protein NDU88_002936 [Pleurodeles waltl]|uniref:Uncharacterized protein n=1 Tax=Pleurodeles waltl TaxID=8319 RepID=A0AAV7MP39_PLEWA|nr:hypothetical protein NDU88_002936 [Pleurodeles waltl]
MDRAALNARWQLGTVAELVLGVYLSYGSILIGWPCVARPLECGTGWLSDGHIEQRKTPALLLPVPVFALKGTGEGEAVVDQAVMRGEGKEFDQLHCAW